MRLWLFYRDFETVALRIKECSANPEKQDPKERKIAERKDKRAQARQQKYGKGKAQDRVA